MIIIQEDQLEQFVKELDLLKPQSFPIFKLAENHLLQNSFAWPGIEFIVDKFPNFTACIVRPKPDSKEYVPRFNHYVYNALATDLDNFKRLLEEPGVVHWESACYFEEIPENLQEALEEVCNQHGEAIGPAQQSDLTTTGWIISSSEVAARIKMPEGLTTRPLDREDMLTVHRLWDYGAGTAETLDYLYYLYDHKFPTMGIYNANNQLIGFSIASDDLSLGAGYVFPEYRGRGLHHLVGYGLCKEMAAIGQEVAYAFVYEGNKASQKSVSKGGAVKADHWKLVYILYKPKNVDKEDRMVLWFDAYLKMAAQAHSQ